MNLVLSSKFNEIEKNTLLNVNGGAWGWDDTFLTATTFLVGAATLTATPVVVGAVLINMAVVTGAAYVGTSIAN
jgi:hypothetical protein